MSNEECRMKNEEPASFSILHSSFDILHSLLIDNSASRTRPSPCSVMGGSGAAGKEQDEGDEELECRMKNVE